MKTTPTIEEAIYIEGLPDWYTEITPPDLWTREAFELIQAARLAGLIGFDSKYSWRWTTGENIPKAALAYFCKRASKQLRLNRGSHTYWQPFEIMFNSGLADPTDPIFCHACNPLRLCLHNLEESAGQEAIKERIDRFFDSYEQSKTTKTQ